MKIIIFYASYGGGHLNAAKSIYEHILSTNNTIDVELIDCMKYVNKPIEKITTTAYNEMAKKIPWAWGRIYADSQKGPLAHISTRSNKIMAIKLLKLLRNKKPDLIISTHPFGSQMCSYLKRKNKITSKIATILTDFAPHDQWLVGHEQQDYFFVAHNKMKDYLINKGIDENKIFTTGIPISKRFLNNYNKKDIFEEFKLKDSKKTILFFGGGQYGLSKNKILLIFESLISLESDIQIIAIAGKNKKLELAFEEIVNKYKKQDSVKILGFTDKVPELMQISDIVFTKPGGLTTSESLASHLPMVIINPIPGQEEENAEFLEKNEIAVWLKKHSNTTSILTSLLNNTKKIEYMAKNTEKLAHPNSTEEICKILLK